jgi:large conductance mechanosensitive channel
MKGFKDFLLKNSVLALAIGFIMGAATGKVVSSLVADVIMPVISLALPAGEWRSAKWELGAKMIVDGKETVKAINYGTFFGSVVDFVVIAFVVYMITKALIKEAPAAPTKKCPRCMESIAPAATKCKFCTADIG